MSCSEYKGEDRIELQVNLPGETCIEYSIFQEILASASRQCRLSINHVLFVCVAEGTREAIEIVEVYFRSWQAISIGRLNMVDK